MCNFFIALRQDKHLKLGKLKATILPRNALPNKKEMKEKSLHLGPLSQSAFKRLLLKRAYGSSFARHLVHLCMKATIDKEEDLVQ